jgi:hypothetical protein
VSEENVVEFRDEHGSALVRLSYEPRDQDVGTLFVEMRTEGLACDWPAESGRGDDLHSFLAALERDWKGWRGCRHWETIWRELSIDATHRGHAVEFLFMLRIPYRGSEELSDTPNLEVLLPIQVSPGESLSRLVAAASRLDKTFPDPALE